MNFSDINEAISWLEHQPRFRPKTSLDYIKKAYDYIGIDLKNIKKIHVAGTNGKGSTSAFITNILINNNIKVGTFTSPYLVRFNERIKLNNIDINDEELLKYINFMVELNNKLVKNFDFKLSFFELVTLISFKYFYDNNTDVIVIEVGIGGRLDATNILEYDVSIITSIGYDHIQQLGNTLESITYEKMGILKNKGYLLSAVNEPLKKLMINQAIDLDAEYKFLNSKDIKVIDNEKFIYNNKEIKLDLLGDFQRTNSLLAYYAVKYLCNLNDDKIIPYLETTKWDGRLEKISNNVYIDGAHNLPAIEALMRNISILFKDKKITVLYSALKDKDINGMLDIIKEYGYNIVLTSFPDFRFESLKSFKTNDIDYIENGFETLKALISNKEEDEVIIVTGSLHFIGYIKQNI